MATDLLRRGQLDRPPTTARDALWAALGAVGLARAVALEVAGRVAVRLLWAVTPSPVREWIDWQERATWRVK